MVNGYCFGGGFTQVCACDFAVAADEAHLRAFGSQLGHSAGRHRVVERGQMLNLPRRDVLRASTGDTFDGKKAKDDGLHQFLLPAQELKQETMKLAQKLMEKSPAAVRYTKEALRAVRFMNEPQAADYLNAKSDALAVCRQRERPQQGMRQFLDDKSFRPGFGAFRRDKATRA